jgi:hypothetical protein
MKVEVASDKKFVGSSGCRGKEVLKLFKEDRKFVRVNRRGWATVDIVDRELRRRQLEGDGRDIEAGIARRRKRESRAGFAGEKSCATTKSSTGRLIDGGRVTE